MKSNIATKRIYIISSGVAGRNIYLFLVMPFLKFFIENFFYM